MIEDQKQSDKPQTQPDAVEKKPKPIGKLIAIIIIVVLLAICAWLAWQLWACLEHDGKVNSDNQHLQSQVDKLTKQLSDAQSTAKPTASTSQATACTTGVPASDSLKENIAAAINSKNTAALEGYMASSVKVVVAASEKGDTETPADATKSVEYTYSGTAPWNFSLAASTLASYRAGFYKQYFPDNAYVGKASNNQVVSFGFDCNGKINMIFMAADESLLM